MQSKRKRVPEGLESKLNAVTNQLLDLGKRNRLLNYQDKGLKTLKLLNKNTEEIFRGVKGYRDLKFFDTDATLTEFVNNPEILAADKKGFEDLLHLTYEQVYGVTRKYLQRNEILCYKAGYQLVRALKSLYKDMSSSMIEKGINPLYISFGFIHYTENDGETYTAPLLLIPVELSNEEGYYSLRQYEDDILLNPTLAFYLETAYNIVLPEYGDEAYSTYLEKLQAVVDQEEKVTFEDGASLGIYSFYKMNMYNDLLSHKEMVLENKNIRRLLGEPDSIEILDENMPVYPVVNCDSSQLEAVQNAANGKSFCLQGPPGSGKSQTITNMISTFLGQRKKVLFVSEKIAALNVVFENLRRAKLSEFALEIHSNKASKKEFIEKLYTAATLPRYELNVRTKITESRYLSLKNKLNHYEQLLHQMIPGLECSLFDLYSMYLGNDVNPLGIHLDLEDFNIMTLDEIILLFNEYTIYTEYIGSDYRKSGLYGLNLENINNLGELATNFSVAIEHVQKLINVRNQLNESSLGMKFDNVMDIYNGLSYMERINKTKTYNKYLFIKASRNRLLNAIDKYNTISPNLKCDELALYDANIVNEDLDLCYKKIEENNKGLFKNAEFKEYSTKILNHRKNKKAKAEEILEEIKKISAYKRYYAVAKNYINDLNKYLGNYEDYDLAQVFKDCQTLSTLPDMDISEERFKVLKEEAIKIPSYTYFKPDSIHLMSAAKIFYKKDIDLYTSTLERIYDRFVAIYQELDYLYNYQELMVIVGKMKRYKCLDFLHTYLDYQLPIEEIGDCYKKTFVKQKIDEIHETHDDFKNFDRAKTDDIINEFRDLDEKMFHINRDFIISENSQMRQVDIVEGSQFKLLDKEYNKTRRQLPIRTLLEKIMELALEIKPVFLMSPLSVSTYLASELNMFDVVIFDEASQIFACDAFGSIYRGKQCIVIGDTKQMPPTSFFQASAETIGSQVDEETEVEEENDLDSILDKASELFETKALKWHYRSRTEELIVFSNNNFYNSNLITIPQSRHHERGFGIDYYYIPEGRYDMTSRTNPLEAQAICDMVFEHLDNSTQSVGVVAFSNVQAELIQSLIDKRLRKQPKYEKFFDPELEEPVFVKNLESVQGDERDRIIFSICYGYNNEGKFYQRFGPLNASGGERRLNVAVTRAKINVSVVASIHYNDIKDNPNSEGVTRFKEYLKFAEYVVDDKNYEEDNSGTVKAITEKIEELGYTVVPNYGYSAFKVDMAIKKDEDFVLAIMIDGKSKYSTNLSDNYRLERMLLERQGWKYYKLFTTSWIENPEKELERIKACLDGTLVEGVEYESHPEEVSYLRREGNADVIDMSYAVYEFLDRSKGRKLFQQGGLPNLIKEIIRVETPIHKEFLYKRVASIIDVEKITQDFKDRVTEALPERLLKIGDFYFNFKVSDIKLRLESGRDVGHIFVDELADGLYNVVIKNNGISEGGAFKTIVNMLGYERVTAQSKQYLVEALEHLILDHKVVETNNNLYLVK